MVNEVSFLEPALVRRLQQGELHLNQVFAVVGLRGNPYGNGRCQEPVNALTTRAGVGRFVLASLELGR